jgi:hypothetical protein
MPLTRRDLLEKSLVFGAATFLPRLGPALQRDSLAGQPNLLAFTHVTVVTPPGNQHCPIAPSLLLEIAFKQLPDPAK